MINKIITLTLLLLAVACSAPVNDVTNGDGANTNTITLDNLDSLSLEYNASQDQIVDIELGPVHLSSGEIISNSNLFDITPNNSETAKVKIKVDSYDDDSDQFGSNTILVKGTSDGKLKFRVQIPRIADEYSLSVKSQQYPSLGLIKIKVKPNAIHSLGSVQSEVFKDLAPYNGLKEINEPYAVVSAADTTITLGPVVDEFGNKVLNGNLDVLVTNAYIGGGYKDKDDNITSQGTFSIIEGNVILPIHNFAPDLDVRVLAVISGAVGTSSDFNNLPPGKFIDQELTVVDSFVTVLGLTDEDLLDFGVVYIGRSEIKTLNIKNLGNAKIINLNTVVDAPFVKVGGTCESGSVLEPGQECSVDIQYSAQSRVFGHGALSITGRFSGVVLPEKRIELMAQSALPASLQLSLENNLIEFEPTPVGDVVSQIFTVVNMGDVAATNLRFIQPSPHPGQNVGFFTFRSPPASVPNDDPSLGEHCGQNLEPQKRCKVYIDFLPQGKVGNDILAGNVVIDDTNPITIFVKGRSFVNNFERVIGISAVKYNIRKDESDTVDIVVGPVRDIYGVPVADQDVQLEVFSWENEQKTIRRPLGLVSSPNLIIGSDDDLHTIRTDSQGYANFQLKSKVQDPVGPFVVEAKILDNEANVLAVGTNDQFKFVGVNLAFEFPIYNYARTVISNKTIKNVKLENKGSMNAQNVGLQFTEEYFILENEGTCYGISSATLNLDVNASCEFELSFTPNQRTAFFDYMKVTSSNFGTKGISDVYGIGISPVDLNSETPRFVATHIIGQNEALSGFVVFNNIGDETAINLAAKTLDENQSFNFQFTCESLESGRSCVLDFIYEPQTIPNPILNTQIAISGIGQQAGLLDEVKIPVEIIHSSMRFTTSDPGININRCYELQVEGFDTEEDNLDYSQNIPLSLSNEGAAGSFYFDLNCSTPISSVSIIANTYKTNKFYYKATAPGFHVLSANSPEIASAVKGFKIYKEPSSLAIAGGNSQNSYTDRVLNPSLILKVIDEDGNGIPNIPLSLTLLEDITQKTQLITNPTFNSGISGWTVTSGAQWFRGYGGSLRLASLTQAESATSTPMAVTPGSSYYYATRVSESIGTPGTAALKVQLINHANDQVIQEHILEGKKTQVFEFTPVGGQNFVKVKLSTVGYSTGTAVFVDGVFFTGSLDVATNNPVRYGVIQNTAPFVSGFTGEGEFKIDYKTGEIPALIAIKATSSYPTLIEPSALMNVNVEFPTNITGGLGDLRIAATGVTLDKNGGNNITALSSISGYNWNSTTKTLTLPANQIYDFNNVTIESNTTLKLNAPANKAFDWTSMYAKQSCLIDGKIEIKGFKTNNSQSTVNAVGLDGETLSASLPPYDIGNNGGQGGTGGYQEQYRSRTANASCFKACSWSYSGWSGWNWKAAYVQDSSYSRLSGGVGSAFKGGDGAPGRPGKYGTTIRPNGGNGGVGGVAGNDGGLFFLHCFLSLQGNGFIDVKGVAGGNGGNGGSGDYYVGAAFNSQNKYYSGLNPISIQETRRINISGGGGGGSGGDGGRGGKIVIKSKSLNHALKYEYTGGNPGIGGGAGPSTWNYPATNGLGGPGGNLGDFGFCQEVSGPMTVNCP